MNKRDSIAWQFWVERQPFGEQPGWAKLRRKLPRPLAVAFARYVSSKFMGGRERKWLWAAFFYGICGLKYLITGRATNA